MGEDVPRYAGLLNEIRDCLGETVTDRLVDLAVNLSRNQVLDRAAPPSINS